MPRPKKPQYYLGIAQAVGMRGTCLRRNYGAVIVKDDVIISTGYTGAPRNLPNCSDIGNCQREKLGIKPGKRYDLCRSVHAEMNAIIAPTRASMIGATIYIAELTVHEFGTMSPSPAQTLPCYLCMRMIYNSGIERIIVRNFQPVEKEDMKDIILKNDYYNPDKQTELDL